jgi:hypothetical protein
MYYSAIRLYDTNMLADLRNQSDRNIRKVRALMLKRLREKLSLRLRKRIESGQIITLAQKEFLLWYETLDSTKDE